MTLLRILLVWTAASAVVSPLVGALLASMPPTALPAPVPARSASPG